MIVDETPELVGSLHPGFQPFVVHFVNEVRRAGVPLVVISGTRAAPLADPDGNIALDSLHLAGLAFDVQVLGFLRDQVPAWFWRVLGEFWEAMGGRWGGRFNLPDVNHFDAGRAPGSTSF